MPGTVFYDGVFDCVAEARMGLDGHVLSSTASGDDAQGVAAAAEAHASLAAATFPVPPPAER